MAKCIGDDLMKLRRLKLTSVLVLTLILFSSISFAEDRYLQEAENLKEINVFKGSESGFELNRQPTRLEGGIIFVKLLGGEEEALTMKYAHPFTDVPDWGSPFVGYLYEKGFTKGVSETRFGANDKMLAKSFMTFLLRALEYDDKTGDYTWATALEKSNQIGMVDSHLLATLQNEVFLRDHLAKLSFDALKTPLKGQSVTLASKLVKSGSISTAQANALKLLDPEIKIPVNDSIKSSTSNILNVMDDISGVSNYKDLDGLRHYRPLTINEIGQVPYDDAVTMEPQYNDYTINQLKNINAQVNWDNWMQLKWTKFDWNNQSHGSNLDFDDYWKEYDGDSPATASSYANAFGLRLPSEEELKAFFDSLPSGPTEDLAWPSGYYWTGDRSLNDSEIHRFVDSLNKMGQEYNDTRDYFVILVGPIEGQTNGESKRAPNLVKETTNETSNINSEAEVESSKTNGIYASDKKIKGMKDIPGVANSISINGVLIYRPLTTDEVVNVLGQKKYDYSISGKYGYRADSNDPNELTVESYKNQLTTENVTVNWDTWLNLEWPLYDNSFEPIEYSLGSEFEGSYTSTHGDLLDYYSDANLTLTPKYLLDTLQEAYPNGKVTSTFGWPTNMDYKTSTKDQFGFEYTTSLGYKNSSVHIGKHAPCYLSFVKYDDVDKNKLVESSAVE